MVIHKVWGFLREASPARHFEALRVVCSPSSILHLLAWKLGASPVRMLGARSDVGLAGLMTYLFTLAAQLLLGQPPRAPPLRF